jgi:hypothetical protein
MNSLLESVIDSLHDDIEEMEKELSVLDIQEVERPFCDILDDNGFVYINDTKYTLGGLYSTSNIIRTFNHKEYYNGLKQYLKDTHEQYTPQYIILYEKILKLHEDIENAKKE